jgi:hypothetical protein
MRTQWFKVTGRVYRDDRDRVGESLCSNVLVIEGRVAVMDEKIPGVNVSDLWEGASRWLPDMNLKIEELDAPEGPKR